MPELSRAQILVYGALAVAVLLLGARWLRMPAEAGAGSAAASGGSGSLSFSADAVPSEAEGSRDVVVHVAGAVSRPGVYRLPAGSRVADALQRAGGAAAGGDQNAINLAARLADGQQILVPGPGAPAAKAGAGPISLGTATAGQLDRIDGIGPATARDIIAFRDSHGGLSSIEELDQVSGIGPATMEALRARLQP